MPYSKSLTKNFQILNPKNHTKVSGEEARGHLDRGACLGTRIERCSKALVEGLGVWALEFRV